MGYEVNKKKNYVVKKNKNFNIVKSLPHTMRVENFFHKFEGESFTYDDIIFLPSFIDFPIENVSLQTKLTKHLNINIPLVSSPMDTVTEAQMAVAIALQGGIGFIHYNMSYEEMREQLLKVKRFKNGFVLDPVTLSPLATIKEVIKIRQKHGYSIIPITQDGEIHGKLLGLITKYDYSATSDQDKQIYERMTPVEKLTLGNFEVLCPQGELDLTKANEKLISSHQAALPIVDKFENLIYLMTQSDLEKHQKFPLATVDDSQKLLVGAAIETWEQKAFQRLDAISDIVDVIVFDTSQGFSKYAIDLIKYTKQNYGNIQVIGGNVVTKDACLALINAGVDAVRVGMGSGSICTTQEVTGIGRGQASAIYHCSEICNKNQIPVIADGGISKSSDILKALSLGASSVMLGSLLACTTDACGKSELKDGIVVKEYRGMGSGSAMLKNSAFRYGIQNTKLKIPEGVTGTVPSKGPAHQWVPYLLQGVKQGLHKLGFSSIKDLHLARYNNNLLLEKRSLGSKVEGGVHSLYELKKDFTNPVKRTSDHHEHLNV